VAEVDRHDRLHERLTVADGMRRAADGNILAALHPVEIGEDEAQNLHALGLKLLDRRHIRPPPEEPARLERPGYALLDDLRTQTREADG